METFADGPFPLRFTAYDGSSAGPEDADSVSTCMSPRGTTYLATAPGDLGLVRAYVAGDLNPIGVHPGDPVRVAHGCMDDELRPHAAVRRECWPTSSARSASSTCMPIAPPPQEAPPRWRRVAEGLRHSKTRDAEAIHHHYDVSNTFYE